MTASRELGALLPLRSRRGELYFAGEIGDTRIIAVPAPGAAGSSGKGLVLFGRCHDGAPLEPWEVDDLLARAADRDRAAAQAREPGAQGLALLVVGPTGRVCRLDAPARPAAHQTTTPLRCPFCDEGCTARCAMLGAYEVSPHGLIGLECRAQGNPQRLGLLDPEHVDLDQIETLTWGSAIAESRRRQ